MEAEGDTQEIDSDIVAAEAYLGYNKHVGGEMTPQEMYVAGLITIEFWTRVEKGLVKLQMRELEP